MPTLKSFLEFVLKVNFEHHIPTDIEIRAFFTKNSLSIPHMDIQMLECLKGHGTFESVLTMDHIRVLPENERLILKVLNEPNRKINAYPGKIVILPHPFYIVKPDLKDGKIQVRHRASIEL